MMTLSSRPTTNVNERIAETLVAEQVRAPIVRRVSHVPLATISRFYLRHHGRGSKSGQMPFDLHHLAENHDLSSHAALLLLAYREIARVIRAEVGEKTPADVISDCAFTRALTFYNHTVCGGKPLISGERAYTLIQHFADKAAFPMKVGTPNGIKLGQCSTCRTPLVIAAHFAEYTCACCQSARRRAGAN